MSETGPVSPAEIVSVGLVTPVGLYAAAASAAIAAGRSRARRSEVLDKADERQAMHLVEEDYLEPLNPALVSISCTAPHRRMLQLGGAALAEAAAGCPVSPPLLLALPEVLPGSPDPVGASFVSHLATQAGIQVDGARSATYRQGGAGVLFALRDGLEMLAAKKASHLIVGGVDTFFDVMRLAMLDSEGRLCGSCAIRSDLPTSFGWSIPPTASATRARHLGRSCWGSRHWPSIRGTGLSLARFGQTRTQGPAWFGRRRTASRARRCSCSGSIEGRHTTKEMCHGSYSKRKRRRP